MVEKYLAVVHALIARKAGRTRAPVVKCNEDRSSPERSAPITITRE
jgi:hypothetical protein